MSVHEHKVQGKSGSQIGYVGDDDYCELCRPAPPTGDALREAAQEMLDVEKAQQLLRANPYRDTESEMEAWDAMHVGYQNALSELREALASHPVETKGPWEAYQGRSKSWWAWQPEGALDIEHYGPFTEPQARGVARELNRQEPKE